MAGKKLYDKIYLFIPWTLNRVGHSNQNNDIIALILKNIKLVLLLQTVEGEKELFDTTCLFVLRTLNQVGNSNQNNNITLILKYKVGIVVAKR